MTNTSSNTKTKTRTATKWRCVYCKKVEYKPLWLAKKRKFCQVRCRVQDTLKKNPSFYKEIGSKSDPLRISLTLKTKGIKPPSRLGTKMSEESRRIQSERVKLEWATGVRKPCLNPKISPEGRQRKIKATQAMRRRLAKRGRLTNLEKIIDGYLHAHKILHKHEYVVGTKLIDFYLPTKKLFIEADGDYWHQDKTKDLIRDAYIKKLRPDVKIVRCRESSILDGTWVYLIWGAKRGV